MKVAKRVDILITRKNIFVTTYGDEYSIDLSWSSFYNI